MSDLTDFLLARIAEDEQQTARSWPFSNAKIAADCEAKRHVIRLALRPTLGAQGFQAGVEMAMNATLRLLALPYADHPDYLEEWRP